jgi:hypothetical protein
LTIAYSNLTLNATDRAVKSRNGTPSGSPDAGKRKTDKNPPSSVEEMKAAAPRANSIPEAGDPVQSKQAHPFHERFLAPGPPRENSGSTTRDCHEPATLFSSRASTRSPSGGSLFAPSSGHESNATTPSPLAGGLFGSSGGFKPEASTSRSSGGNLFGSFSVSGSEPQTQKPSEGGLFGASSVSDSKPQTQKSSGSGFFGPSLASNSKTSTWGSSGALFGGRPAPDA